MTLLMMTGMRGAMLYRIIQQSKSERLSQQQQQQQQASWEAQMASRCLITGVTLLVLGLALTGWAWLHRT
ncbi:hypothetical protein GPECTOR_13g789 [Gonium pectorale]|uniref:Uncharacterized protein n=1 Tax=Gonium pectorale TaxID=33097 RepID=A0A150GNJ5_GONPE|nr:hypothetical protein GPECTOR_13g789 [Gonium pectorale]|eukprot:KXZ51302.1 hypothetical protein GPECTOR_13g789 [Gonium pectorale]